MTAYLFLSIFSSLLYMYFPNEQSLKILFQIAQCNGIINKTSTYCVRLQYFIWLSLHCMQGHNEMKDDDMNDLSLPNSLGKPLE